jgi:biopolymer transport protein TolQ
MNEAMSSDVIQLVTQSGPVAKVVLAVLLGFSIVSWALIVEKYVRFRTIRRQSLAFTNAFREARRPAAVLGAATKSPESPLARMYTAAYREFAGSTEVIERAGHGDGFAADRLEAVSRAMRRTASVEISKPERFLPFLATTASASSFIGLFGTVWGVMTAFHGIGREGSAGLAVVAPGISEALIATAAGLAAAIPAVIAYNYFVNRVRSWGVEMDNFTLDFLNFLTRPVPAPGTKVTNNVAVGNGV